MTHRQPPTSKEIVHISGAGTMAMYVLVASLSVLFAASVFGLLMIRFLKYRGNWPPPGLPALPSSLWISTAIILLSSVTIQFALSAVKRGNERNMRWGLGATVALGLSFLLLQSINWWQFTSQLTIDQHTGPYVSFFYVLTGLHAAHVIGGLIPLITVWARALAGRYSANYHPGVRYCTIYWHFLDIIWVMLFVVLYLV